MAWDPTQYQQYQQQRAAPFEDALALVRRRDGLRVIDLGCGTGELTRRLGDALPGSDVLGIDSSAQMLARAVGQARPGVRFEQRSIEELAVDDTAGNWDLLFSHAALHWVADHAALIPRLFAMLAPGGQLVVQVPSNAGHPSQQQLRALAAEEPFGTALGGWIYDWPVLSINDYGERLHRVGGLDLVLFEKLYCHVLPSSDDIVEWMRGTAVVPYLERLPSPLHPPFLERYRQRLRTQWPEAPVFFGFRRTLFSASRA